MAQGGKTDSGYHHPGESGSTHFGYQDVAWEQKARRVREVFDSVADRYDLMNDLMSFGVHRLWKRFAISQSGLKPGQQALDVAGGSGDLTCLLAAKVGHEGRDLLRNFISVGRGITRQTSDLRLQQTGAAAPLASHSSLLTPHSSLKECIGSNPRP